MSSTFILKWLNVHVADFMCQPGKTMVTNCLLKDWSTCALKVVFFWMWLTFRIIDLKVSSYSPRLGWAPLNQLKALNANTEVFPENSAWAFNFTSHQVVLVVKNPPANAGDLSDVGSTPGLGTSPGVDNGNSLQYSCLENSMERGDWWATVHGAAKNWTPHTHREPCPKVGVYHHSIYFQTF